MDSIPVRLRPFVKRLEDIEPPLSNHELQSILFVVRCGDILHQSFYGSFLTLSLISKLSNHLGIPDLFLEVEVFVMKWSFRQGTVVVSHRMTFDYDMYTVFRITKIAKAVLNDSITPKQALVLIKQHETKQDYTWIERGYRNFENGRALVIPLMSFTCATVYFGGTWYDLGFSFACGSVAGLVAWITSHFTQLTGVMDYLVAILVAMVSVACVDAFPNNSCFAAQVMGTLYWFFYGTAFVLSLYEITNNQLVTGLSRFVQATLRSYGLAFGTLIGVWLAFYGTQERFETMLEECSTKQSQVSDLWFILLFPLSAIACLMQFRVALKHFIICLVVQTIAYGSQYLIATTWNQPEFVANLCATFLATLASAAAISVLHQFKVHSFTTSFSVPTVTAIKSLDTKMAATESHGEQGRIQSLPPTADESGANAGHVEASGSARLRRTTQETEAVQNSDLVGFVDAHAGYVANDEVTYARTDMWFCLMPALYLLVPGSKILQAGFMDLLGSVAGAENDENMFDSSALTSSLLFIGLGQVIGLRLGFVTLWLGDEALKCIKGRFGARRGDDS